MPERKRDDVRMTGGRPPALRGWRTTSHPLLPCGDGGVPAPAESLGAGRTHSSRRHHGEGSGSAPSVPAAPPVPDWGVGRAATTTGAGGLVWGCPALLLLGLPPILSSLFHTYIHHYDNILPGTRPYNL